MHITIWLNGDQKYLKTPTANLHLFQSLLYALLPPERAAFLHDEGFPVEGRKMKLFAMSWPIAAHPPIFEKKHILFPLPVRLVVSTPVMPTLDGFAAGALGAGPLRVGHNAVRCERVEAVQQTAEGETLTVRTLSPITCYDQAERNGKPYTIYFSPYQKDFGVSVANNLARKFRALHPDRALPEGELRVTPLGRPHEKVAVFSAGVNFPIKGWSGRFRLTGPTELLQLALDCGLGAKNSSGWGCVEKL